MISSVTSTNPTDCGAEDGTINILANAGTGTFQYSISGSSGPWQSSSAFTGLAPGSYEVWVRNATATCPVEWASAIQLSDPPIPVISSVTPNNPTDCGAENGTIVIIASAGTGTFQYSISGAAGPWQSSSSFTGLAPGSYEVWVRNATATCPVEWASTINLSDPPLSVISSVTPTNPTDCGAEDGTISILANAGTGAFSIQHQRRGWTMANFSFVHWISTRQLRGFGCETRRQLVRPNGHLL
ncbi:MAG: SprB repeat-containing protein [Flavobacteriales bacterium]|nr:SprB repeat-containing protein [Flavobacteriales bacterium]